MICQLIKQHSTQNLHLPDTKSTKSIWTPAFNEGFPSGGIDMGSSRCERKPELSDTSGMREGEGWLLLQNNAAVVVWEERWGCRGWGRSKGQVCLTSWTCLSLAHSKPPLIHGSTLPTGVSTTWVPSRRCLTHGVLVLSIRGGRAGLLAPSVIFLKYS